MTPEKPSKNEEEYHARRDLELLESHRKQRLEAELEAERRTHYMKCPKDGRDIAAETFHGIQIDRCPHCGGIWLDAGELDALIAKENTGLLGRVFSDISATLRGSKAE